VACSDGGRLPFAVEEARSVAALLGAEVCVEECATREALIQRAPGKSVVHLAAHADARLDNPTFAHLQLTGGQLSTVDVFNLDLGGALVTLSACETGRGVASGGDEVIALSRGFLYAGAAAIVQSLWRVDDAITAQLMTGFYRALWAGQPAGDALRAAQLSVAHGAGAHPYWWAAFQLVGNSRWRYPAVVVGHSLAAKESACI
jgi:CHAT domain-containing protein